MCERSLGRHRTRNAQMLRVIAEQHGEQRRLAGAVSADESHLLSVAPDKRHGLQNPTRPDFDAQILYDQHSRPPPVRRRAMASSAAPAQGVGTKTSFSRNVAGVMRILL